MKNIIELQRKTQDLSEDIKDVLHATSINLEVVTAQLQKFSDPTVPQRFKDLCDLLHRIQILNQQRPQVYMNYLITKQIQEEEESVRRQRLTDYEEKIYDQRRIVCDKQAFFESLLRPKKKRPPTQTLEQFQQVRVKERAVQQQLKTNLLFQELEDIRALKKIVEQQQRNGQNSHQLQIQKTKYNQCNLSSSAGHREWPAQKSALQDSANQNQKKYVRNCSLQQSVAQPASPRRAESQSQQHTKTLAIMLEQISKFRQQNIELGKIYGQQYLALKFKKSQFRKAADLLQTASKKMAASRQQLKQIKSNQEWRYSRCFQPVSVTRKTTSVQKY